MKEDKRLDKRHPLVAEVVYQGGGVRQMGRISDISRGGVFIDTLNPLDVGTPVNFSFLLPGDATAQPITGEGLVAWKQLMLGMGVRFTRLAEGDSERILAFLGL